jgi:hypothetical protein
MPKANVLGGDWLPASGPLNFPEEVDILCAVDCEPTRKEVRWEKGVRHVFLNFHEPRGVRISNQYLYNNKEKFELIITHDPDVMEKCKQAVFMPFGGCWIDPEDRKRLEEGKKEYAVSMICGYKDYMPGHLVRREIWKRQEEIKIPRKFYQSCLSKPPGFNDNPKLESNNGSKALVMDCMFHLAIENCQETNYFTEKIIDCFVTRTSPIYYGCPEIGKWFDTRGIIRVNSADEAIKAANSVTPDTYMSMLPHIIINEKMAEEFAKPMADRVQKIIMEKMYANRRSDG